MRILMTCGGTGGHINPAIAIANTVKNNLPGSEILFVGTSTGKERELVTREGYDIRFVESLGIYRSVSPSAILHNIKALYTAVVSPFKASKILREFAPDVVVGTGGYACWPVLRAAARLHISSAVHESNAIPGMAVKKLQNKVDRIFTNFERSADYLSAKDKIMRVGNPLRTAFSGMDAAAAREKLGIAPDEFLVLSYGGSLGADFLNETVIKCMATLSQSDRKIRVIHATGKRAYEGCLSTYRALGLEGDPRFSLVDYIFDMPAYMAAADVVICRAGAMTVSELSMMGKVGIMVPSPNVVDNHQYKNAKVLSDAEAVVLKEESALDPEGLCRLILDLKENPAEREKLSQNIRKFADPEANRKILDELVRMAKI